MMPFMVVTTMVPPALNAGSVAALLEPAYN
jgi:hypothetical protein